MMNCTSAKVACRLARIEGMDTLTMKKSSAARKAPVRTTASELHLPGSGVSTEAAGGLVVVAEAETFIGPLVIGFRILVRGKVWLFYNGCVVDCRRGRLDEADTQVGLSDCRVCRADRHGSSGSRDRHSFGFFLG